MKTSKRKCISSFVFVVVLKFCEVISQVLSEFLCGSLFNRHMARQREDDRSTDD